MANVVASLLLIEVPFILVGGDDHEGAINSYISFYLHSGYICLWNLMLLHIFRYYSLIQYYEDVYSWRYTQSELSTMFYDYLYAKVIEYGPCIGVITYGLFMNADFRRFWTYHY